MGIKIGLLRLRSMKILQINTQDATIGDYMEVLELSKLVRKVGDRMLAMRLDKLLKELEEY